MAKWVHRIISQCKKIGKKLDRRKTLNKLPSVTTHLLLAII